MALTIPNLDDRTYADLVEEARGLLVAYAPELTNHNPSDPLITLTELFAYFTEALLFRMNVITDANRRAFLRLLNGPPVPPAAGAGAPAPPLTGAALDAEVRTTVLNARRTDRAVTPADFETLSLAADARIARVKCLPGLNLDLPSADPAARYLFRPSHVSVALVPFVAADFEDVKNAVADALEQRRLLATQVHVVKPRDVSVSVQVTVHLLPDALESDVRPRVLNALEKWFDPITGGRDGSGWPFGRSVYVSEIYQLLDGLAGVDFVTRTPAGTAALDELRTDSDDRLKRNANQELIGITLQPDELVKANIAAADIKIVAPLA